MGCLFLICSGESTPSNMTKICGGPTNLQHFDISLNISGRGYEHTKMLSLLPKLPKSLRLCHLANIKKKTLTHPPSYGAKSRTDRSLPPLTSNSNGWQLSTARTASLCPWNFRSGCSVSELQRWIWWSRAPTAKVLPRTAKDETPGIWSMVADIRNFHGYPLVNVYIAIENGNVWLIYPVKTCKKILLFIVMLVYQRVGPWFYHVFICFENWTQLLVQCGSQLVSHMSILGILTCHPAW